MARTRTLLTIDVLSANKCQPSPKSANPTESIRILTWKELTELKNQKTSKVEEVVPEQKNKSLKENSSPQPSVETISAQKWLENKYPQKEGVEKIEFKEKDQYNLVGKLEIKDFPQLKIIDVSESEGITELIIDNCSKVEEIDFSNIDFSRIDPSHYLEKGGVEKIADNIKGTKCLTSLKKIKVFKEDNELGSSYNHSILIGRKIEMNNFRYQQMMSSWKKQRSEKLANEEFVKEILSELDNEKKKSTKLIKLVKKALEEINELKYCANELEGHIEYLKGNEKSRLTTFFLKLKVLLGSSAEEYNCENKSPEEISDLINAKLKELEKKLSSQQQTKKLNACKEKVKTQAHDTNNSQLISKIDSANDYPQLVDIQLQVFSEEKNKQVATERKLNFALVALAISVISSIGLLGTILIKTKRSEKARDKIKK